MATKKPRGHKTTSKQLKTTKHTDPMETDLGEVPLNRSDRRSFREAGQIEQDGGTDSFLVVGICASAGGLDALTRFFKATPADCNAAFSIGAPSRPRPTRA